MPNLRPWRDYVAEIAALPKGESRWLPESEWRSNAQGPYATVESICPSCGAKNIWGTLGLILEKECDTCKKKYNPVFRDKDGNITLSAG